MEKMPSAKEQQIMRSLLSVVDNTRAGADPVRAMVKVASDNGYTPQVIERMCESYNKAKSVHMLQKTSADTRADSFPLIDARAVLEQVFPMQKAASEFVKAPNLHTIDFTTQVAEHMQKTAHDRHLEIEKEAEKDTDPVNVNCDLVYDRLKKKELREAGVMEKAASDIRQERIRIIRTVDDLAEHLRSYSNKKLNKVAQKIYNKYDKKGDQLLDVLYAKLAKDKPSFEKTAKTVIFPLDEPFVSVTRAMEGYRHYSDLTTAQKKIEKSAAGLSHILAAAGIPSLNEATMAATEKDVLDDKGKTLLGAELNNRLRRLDAIDTFSDIYTKDDFLRNQPVEQVMKAFNSITSMMPSLMKDDARKEHIKPLLRKLVSEGNRVDPLDVSRFATMESELSKADKATQEAGKMQEEQSAKDKEGQKSTLGHATIASAVEKAKQPKTKTTAFTEAVKGPTTLIESASKGVGDLIADKKTARSKADDELEAAEAEGRKLDAEEQRAIETGPLAGRMAQLTPTDIERLQADGILGPGDSPEFPSTKAGRDAIQKYLSGGAYAPIKNKPPVEDSPAPEAGTPGGTTTDLATMLVRANKANKKKTQPKTPKSDSEKGAEEQSLEDAMNQV